MTSLDSRFGQDVTSTPADNATIDAFGRQRVSNPLTLFDSKQLHDSQSLFWDDQETSGSGTSTTYNTDEASTSLNVSLNTAGTRTRQSFQRFNYQPGKSQQVFITFTSMETLSTENKKRVGLFDDDNGIFIEHEEGTPFVVRRTNVTGTPVDNRVTQASWNIDQMNGSGVSGVGLDFSKSQILIIDYEWLGVGRVRVGWVVDGKIYYCHEFLNANSLDKVYMSTPNLPIRFEMINDGTGGADSLVHICSSVQSEGGVQKNGVLRQKDSGAISSLATATEYAIVGLRLQSGKLDGVVELEKLSMIATTTNDRCQWRIMWNPTVAGLFSYVNETNSIVAVATGAGVANTISGGTQIDSGFFDTSTPTTQTLENALRLGSTISGTPDEIVLTAKPITNNITVYGSLTWRELS